jgi:preprotein translocase subunit SecE
MTFKEKTTKYWSETQLEIKKVSWPTKDEMIGSTMATIVISLLVAIFIWGVDIGVSKAVISLFKVLA